MRRFSSLSGPVCGGCCQTSRNINGGVNASCSRKPAVPSFDCDRALPPAHESRAMPAMAQTRARKYVEIIVPSRIVLNNVLLFRPVWPMPYQLPFMRIFLRTEYCSRVWLRRAFGGRKFRCNGVEQPVLVTTRER